jgi:hypothetical protein
VVGVPYLRDLGFIQTAIDMDVRESVVSVYSPSNAEQVGGLQSEIVAEEEDSGVQYFSRLSLE